VLPLEALADRRDVSARSSSASTARVSGANVRFSRCSSGVSSRRRVASAHGSSGRRLVARPLLFAEEFAQHPLRLLEELPDQGLCPSCLG
jgi:hypothetical protein